VAVEQQSVLTLIANPMAVFSPSSSLLPLFGVSSPADIHWYGKRIDRLGPDDDGLVTRRTVGGARRPMRTPIGR
jgi:hypothetical protein